MTDTLLIVTVVLLVVALALLFGLLRRTSQADVSALASRLDAFEKAQERAERTLRKEVARSRDEFGKAAREQRQELTEAFKTLGDSVVKRMMDVAYRRPLCRSHPQDWFDRDYSTGVPCGYRRPHYTVVSFEQPSDGFPHTCHSEAFQRGLESPCRG